MIPQIRSMTVGELRNELASFPDYARVEILAKQDWRVALHGIAADQPEDGSFHRVLLLSAAAMPVALRENRRKCTCTFPTYYYSPEGAKGHCTCGAL